MTQTANGDHNVGGGLLGYVTPGRVTIIHALKPGPSAEFNRTSLRSRQGENQALMEQLIAEAKGDLREVGHWHSHPFGFGEPSPTDRQEMAAGRQILKIDNPIELIIRPDLTHAWARPIPAAWVLTDSDARAFEYAVLWPRCR